MFTEPVLWTESLPNKSVSGKVIGVYASAYSKTFLTKSYEYDVANDCKLLFNCLVRDAVNKRKIVSCQATAYRQYDM